MEEILNYEYVTSNSTSDIEKLFYAIICRRWDEVNVQLEKFELDWESLKFEKFRHTVTIERCFMKNLQFLKSNKNKRYYERICNRLGESFQTLVADKKCDYDSKDFYDGKSVFDVFFDGNQPVLDVQLFNEQTLATKQLMKNNATMVLDEVGTGKTVSGIYAMQQVIQQRFNEVYENSIFPSAAILIICPYSKREDWHNDIRRQLGRNSIIINQGDNGALIKQKSQNPTKPLIYIMGCSGGDSDDSKSMLKQSLKKFHQQRDWDLVIIDESHNCFKNYSGISAERIMLLTATPIVVSGGDTREFKEYQNLMKTVLGASRNSKIIGKEISPIQTPNPTEEDIFVCHYKEDIFNVEINRKIKFIPCARTEKRHAWFNKLLSQKDFFTAMYADQDDMHLSKKMAENFPQSLDDFTVNSNEKLEKLAQIIEGECEFTEYATKSIIVFCEMQETVEMIYKRLSYLTTNKTMIGKKYGAIGEIKNITNNSAVVLEKLKGHIRREKANRAILITTGKSGGTGLNLGEFNTVIHYELPYTSNELEQRFGRIERADDLIQLSGDNHQKHNEEPTVIENEMIFLVNEKVEQRSDFETNRMLYYAVSKVNIACKHIPVRNTVLFHPEFSKRIQEDAITYFSKLRYFCENGNKVILEYILYKKEEKEILNIVSIIQRSLEGALQAELENIRNLKEKINKILNDTKSNEIIDQYKEKLITFFEKDDTKVREIDEIVDQAFEYYIWLKNICKFYGQKWIGAGDNEISIVYDEQLENNEDNEENYSAEKNAEKMSDNLNETIGLLKKNLIEQKLSLISLCDNILNTINQINNDQKAQGIFYRINGEFKNESVHQFRRSNEKYGAFN